MVAGLCVVEYSDEVFPSGLFSDNFYLRSMGLKSIEVRVPHTLERDEVRRRLDEALVRAKQQYAATVGDIEASWEGEDRLRVNLTVSGMKFDGTLDILVEELVVGLQVPGMAALFSGRIREGIEERLGGLIGSQQA